MITNLDVVVPQIVMHWFAMNGQFCCTVRVYLAQSGIADRLRAALIRAYQNVRLGEARIRRRNLVH